MIKAGKSQQDDTKYYLQKFYTNDSDNTLTAIYSMDMEPLDVIEKWLVQEGIDEFLVSSAVELLRMTNVPVMFNENREMISAILNDSSVVTELLTRHEEL